MDEIMTRSTLRDLDEGNRVKVRIFDITKTLINED